MKPNNAIVQYTLETDPAKVKEKIKEKRKDL